MCRCPASTPPAERPLVFLGAANSCVTWKRHKEAAHGVRRVPNGLNKGKTKPGKDLTLRP